MDSTFVDADRPRAFAVFALGAGLLSLVLFLFPTVYSPHASGELLPYFERHRSAYILLAVLMLFWVIAAIPSVVATAALVGARGRMLAQAAILLSTAGIVLIGFAVFAFVGGLLAIESASSAAPSAAAAAYQATVWGTVSFYLADPGLMTLGLGQLLFAWLAWNGGAFRRSVSLVGFVGGLAGLLTLATYQTSVLAIVQFAAFAIWGFTTGVVLWRRRVI